jgi:hypothetical protein
MPGITMQRTVQGNYAGEHLRRELFKVITPETIHAESYSR